MPVALDPDAGDRCRREDSRETGDQVSLPAPDVEQVAVDRRRPISQPMNDEFSPEGLRRVVPGGDVIIGPVSIPVVTLIHVQLEWFSVYGTAQTC